MVEVMAKEKESLQLYVSPELKRLVREAAEKDRRSTSAWVEVVLEGLLKQQQAG